MAKTLEVALCGRFFVVFPLARLAADILTAGFGSAEGRDKRLNSLESTYRSLEENSQCNRAIDSSMVDEVCFQALSVYEIARKKNTRHASSLIS